jgi:hypothetical protein
MSATLPKTFAAVVLAFAIAAPGNAGAQAADWGLPNGHFYTQAGGDTSTANDGFPVVNHVPPGAGPGGDQPVRFWDEFQRHGGVAIVGYPASRPFVWDGFHVQAFQKGIFQWRPDQGAGGQAWFMNVFDELTQRGLDDRLLAEKQVPLPSAFDDAGKPYDQVVAGRWAILDTRPAFARQYWSVPDPLALYGLPTSQVQEFDSFHALRLQRAAFQEWKVDMPGVARAGEVTVVNAGDVAKEFGLIPEEVATPLPPPAAGSDIVVYGPRRGETVTPPFTVSGDARVFEATVVWELTDDATGKVLGRGVTQASTCCEWAGYQFEVPSASQRDSRVTLSVYSPSAREEGVRVSEVRIPLVLAPAAALPRPLPVEAVLAAATAHTGLPAANIQVARAEQVEWPDGGLGCPRSDMFYPQVITPGWLVELRAGGKTLEYHTNNDTFVVLCSER